MNKRQLLLQKMAALQKQHDELAAEEQKKVGAAAISLYEKGLLIDEQLKSQIAIILGDTVQKPKIKQDTAAHDENLNNNSGQEH